MSNNQSKIRPNEGLCGFAVESSLCYESQAFIMRVGTACL